MDKQTVNSRFETTREHEVLIPKSKYSDEFKYYALISFATFLFGTKLVLLELSRFSKIWVFFIEHVAIGISAIVLFIGYFIIFKSKTHTAKGYFGRDLSLFKDRRIFYCSLLAGFCGAFGNICIIFAISFARLAESSSASINGILMLNVVFALTAGLGIFGERHTGMQYLGGVLVIGAVILITFERHFEQPGRHTSIQHTHHYTSVFFTLITGVSWSMMIITTKYTGFYYNANIIEYSSLVMGLSGLIGALTGVPIYFFDTPFGFIEKSGIQYHILFAIFAGIFTTVGQFCYFGGVNLGSVEVAQLFVNMKPIVQLIEEAIFLFMFPNLLAFLGIVVAILGASLLILGKRETEHQHPDDMIEKSSV